MKASIIQIGNSKVICIPKVMLEESSIEKDVDIKVTSSGLNITPIRKSKKDLSETVKLSQKSLAREWDTLEEDKAWVNL